MVLSPAVGNTPTKLQESPDFQARLHPILSMLCSALKKRCHDQPILQGQDEVYVIHQQGATVPGQTSTPDAFLCIVGFSSAALQRQHWFALW